jgi:hypothetical protein
MGRVDKSGRQSAGNAECRWISIQSAHDQPHPDEEAFRGRIEKGETCNGELNHFHYILRADGHSL